MAKSGRLELRDSNNGQYRYIFIHCDVFGQQRNRNRRKKTQNKGCYAVQGLGDFLLVITELFSLGIMAEALWAIIGSKSAISLQRGPVDPKFRVEGVAPPTFLFSHKIRINDLSRGIKIWTDFSSVLSQCTRLTDGQTDGQNFHSAR